MTSVAIQGIAGSFHHEAAEHYFGNDIGLVECQSFRGVFEAVSNNLADYGIVAVENSLHGSINAVYRLLATQHLWVRGEVRLKIEQYLIASVPIEDKDFPKISKVYSQAPALAQCENWLNQHVSGDLIETSDTAESVRYVMNNQNQLIAAVAGKRAAAMYGGTIIAGPINDDPDNYTRFFIISNEPKDDPGANRTSIIITEKETDKAGSLYEALAHFNRVGINLSKLDSHPLTGKTRRYSFYIDFDKAIEDKETKDVLNHLASDGWDINVLGCYQQYRV